LLEFWLQVFCCRRRFYSCGFCHLIFSYFGSALPLHPTILSSSIVTPYLLATMSMGLMAACFADSDEDSQSNELPTGVLAVGGSDAVTEMTSNDVGLDDPQLDVLVQAKSQPPVVSGEEEAVCQQGPSELEVTPPKKKQKVAKTLLEPKITPPKKEGRVKAIEVKSKKETRTSASAKPDIAADRMLHCLFEPDIRKKNGGAACIPLWPQYDMSLKNTTKYVRLAPKEAWVIQYTNLRRKAWRKGLEPTVLTQMQSAKESNSAFVRRSCSNSGAS